MRAARALAVMFAGAILGVVTGACSPGPSDRDEPPSLVLVTLDTTRWDRLGAYGDVRARTPFFDRLARNGMQFRNAYVDASTTLPSHATMLTGEISLRHGVRLNGQFALPDAAVTLPERLRDAGYATAAVLSSAALAARYGLDQGFDHYDDAITEDYPVFHERWWIRGRRVQGNQRRAWQTRAAARRALGALGGGEGEPAFLWIHFVDAHQPVDPPPPWDRVPDLPGYDAEIAVVDREMGWTLRDAESVLGECVVAVLADHGENLGEHRDEGHALFLTEPVIRIPFVLNGPGVSAEIVEVPVRNADIAPTLAACAGLPPEELGADGVDLRTGGVRDIIFAETRVPTVTFGGAATQAFRTDRYKYVRSPREELYDLETDPQERINLVAAEPERAAALREELESYVRATEHRTAAAAAPVAP
ncbi:MAG: sulfatase, partial [Gemmatimonadetes bacterium]|nr:sulfatase [Gemmatimonadota bacterium]